MNNECDPALVTIIVSSTSYRKCSPESQSRRLIELVAPLTAVSSRLQLLNSSHLCSLITNKSWFIIDIITISFKFDCPLRCAMWPFGYCETLNIWVWEMFKSNCNNDLRLHLYIVERGPLESNLPDQTSKNNAIILFSTLSLILFWELFENYCWKYFQ